MWTDAVECVKRAAHIEQRYNPLAGDELAALAAGNLTGGRNAYPLGHD
jgi:hypothetical protein